MKLLTIAEVCSVLSISRSKLYALWDTGEGPAYLHIGRHRRVKADTLNAWINARAKL